MKKAAIFLLFCVCVLHGWAQSIDPNDIKSGYTFCSPAYTVAACLAKVPLGGSVVLMPATYAAGSFSPCMSTGNVTVLGAGMPQFNAGNTALAGGTIILGPVPICANGFNASDFGVDVGSAWVAAGHSAANGLSLNGPTGTGADPILVNASLRNIVVLGAGATSPFHGVLVEHYSNVAMNNVESRQNQHCFALKSSHVNADGLKFQGCSVDGIAVKGDTYTQISDINLSNILGQYGTTPGDTNGIQIVATETPGTVSRVTVNGYTTNGVLFDVTLSNSSGVGAGAVSGIKLSALNFYKINTSAGSPTSPTCIATAGSASIDRVHVKDLLCNINDPGQAVAPLNMTQSLTNSALDDLIFIGSGYASDIEGPSVVINGIRDLGAATAQPTIYSAVSAGTSLQVSGWYSNRGNAPFSSPVGATATIVPGTQAQYTADGTSTTIRGNLAGGTASFSSYQATNGVYASGKTTTVSTLSTPTLMTAGAYAGMLHVRDNTSGGSALFMIDPNGGVQIIGTSQITGLAAGGITYSSGWNVTLTSGSVPRTLAWSIVN